MVLRGVALLLAFHSRTLEAKVASHTGGQSMSQSGGGEGSSASAQGADVVLWGVPTTGLIAASTLFILALFSPFFVKFLLSRAHLALARVKDLRPVRAAYGTFAAGGSPQPSVSSPTTAAINVPSHRPTPSVPVVAADLPKRISMHWDKTAWQIVKEQLSFPLSLALFICLCSAAFEVLRLPHSYDGVALRSTVDTIVWYGIVACSIFLLFRFVDLVRKVIGMQPWITVESLYDDIASKAGWAVKLLGGAIVIIVISGLLAVREHATELLFAFGAALALGLGGWVLFEFAGEAQEAVDALTLMYSNVFAVNDKISVYDRDIVKCTGIVKEMNSRTSSIVALDGTTLVVPNTVIKGSCVVNHTRSLNACAVDLHLSSESDPKQLSQFVDRARELLARHPDADTSASPRAFLCGNISKTCLPFNCFFFVKPEAKPVPVRDMLILDLMRLAGEVGIKLAGQK